jgi:hypothetical protein
VRLRDVSTEVRGHMFWEWPFDFAELVRIPNTLPESVALLENVC